jgi:hypothetical protein
MYAYSVGMKYLGCGSDDIKLPLTFVEESGNEYDDMAI